MEIKSGRPVEDLRLPEDLGPNNQPNEPTNMQVTRRWILEQKEKGDLTFGFYSAISQCLRCFADPTASLQNSDFRRTIEEQVLAPLENEMNIRMHGPTTY